MIYERPKNEIFASDAKTGEIVEFPNIKRGWGVTENLGFIPPMEYFNAAFNRVDKALAYQLQRGVSEWSAEEEYPAGAISVFNSKLYQAKVANTNKKPPDNKDVWEDIASEAWSEQTFLKKTDAAADSTKLGGLAADKYAKKDDIPAAPQAATETKAGIVKLKNSITGSLSDTAVSEKAIMDFIASNFANSRQESGYTKLPNGLIFQWGRIGEKTNDPIKVTYPITFPNICLSLIIGNLIDAHPNTTGGGGHQRINSFDNNKTGFTAKGPYGYTSHYLAIGY